MQCDALLNLFTVLDPGAAAGAGGSGAFKFKKCVTNSKLGYGLPTLYNHSICVLGPSLVFTFSATGIFIIFTLSLQNFTYGTVSSHFIHSVRYE